MLTVDEARAEEILAAADLPVLMEAVFRAHAAGEAIVPVRSALRSGEVWFAAMPASVAAAGLRALGAKLVTAFPGHTLRGAPTHQAVVVLLDPDTGGVAALVAAEALTRLRTAAISVVATRALAARPRGRHALLGAGVQAHAHLDAFARAGLLESVHVWSRTRQHAQRLAEAARARGIETCLFEDAASAVRDCDVVTMATASARPLVAARDLSAHVHVNAVGACVPDRCELPAAFVRSAAIVVDSLPAARVEAGDLILALDPADPRWDGMRELGAALGSGGLQGTRPTLFESLGLGIADVAAAAYVVATIRAAPPGSGPAR